jgi:hypothetical protein
MKFETLEDRIEFEKTLGKQGRINRYRALAHLNEGDEITDIDKLAFNRVCVECGCNPHLFRAELLNEDNEYWLKESL